MWYKKTIPCPAKCPHSEYDVITISLVPIPFRSSALTQERNSLFEYPMERLAAIIREIGFTCTACAKCCTREFNGHVFLLDRDVATVRSIDPEALEPAPDPEFCDQNGTFYVSGYALKAKTDEHGSCWFLENGRCRIYDSRFAICRIYPYMLHREPDETGKVDWRQISGLNHHGEYGQVIPDEEAIASARETKEYENAFLTQEISFLECIQEHFARHKLRHVQKIYDDRMRAFVKGGVIRVMVYYDGGFEEHLIRND
ncbi:YkgJ family cysteine cluster protein [Methanoregula sp.]|uniref:YkgJ family cysteine cluster protein n=1 Tax=Methanoregula sp. TaxID=2052170 RepID=UPI003C23E58C